MINRISSHSSNLNSPEPDFGDSLQGVFNLVRRKKATDRFSKNSQGIEATKTASQIANKVIQGKNN